MVGNQANVEYWFRLLYECLHGACYGSAGLSGFLAFLAHLWLWIIIIGYLLAVLALMLIVYATMRLFDLRKREEEYYSTILVSPEEAGGVHPRWLHIESLADSMNPNDWRTAIIEADILLEDTLTKRGYTGDGVGEKLKSIDPSELSTLQNAWEAHKVRNQIAHQGSAFALSETLARRTIAHYASVFREFKII